MVLRGERSSDAPDLLDNLQAWAEHEYDTLLLHSNLSFPLLRKLTEIGDLTAKKRFREEVSYRYSSGDKKLRKFLLEEGYLRSFTPEEILELSVPEDQILALKQVSEELNVELNSLFSVSKVLSGNIWRFLLVSIGTIPKSLLLFKTTLTNLEIYFKKEVAATIPEWFGDLEYLEELKIKGSFTSLPESFGKLKRLKYVQLYGNLTALPDSIGNLSNLRSLTLMNNELSFLPTSLKNLEQLVSLELKGNKFKKIPDVLLDMENLEQVSIYDNPIPSEIVADFVSSAECISGYYKIKNKSYFF